jgi:Protein of unknown function (DUF2934)
MTTKSSHKALGRAAPRKTQPPSRTHSGPAHPRSVAIDALEGDAAGEPDQPFAEGVQNAIDPELRYRMISETAYNLYQDRGYTDGYELDDWLQAEAAVDHLLVNSENAPEAPAKD